MSSPVARAHDGADDLSLYAPKWAAGAPRSSESPIDICKLDAPDWTPEEQPADESLARLDPTEVPQPSAAAGPRFPMLGRIALAGAAAAAVALLLVVKMPGSNVAAVGRTEAPRASAAPAEKSFAARFAGLPAAVPASEELRSRIAERALPPAHRGPPAHRVTTVAIPQASLPSQASLTSQASLPSQPSNERVPLAARELNAEEIAVLIRRGEELVASGDIAAARVVLRRAAEARDARAALALAATYDPLLLSKLVVAGGQDSGDIAAARVWYEKAKAFGSEDAPRRLEQLASRTR